MPDLDLVMEGATQRVFTLLHDARPVFLDLGAGSFDLGPWSDRVRRDRCARCDAPWELPVCGVVAAPTGVLVRPDGHVAWVGEGGSDEGLREALVRWIGAPRAS